METFVGDNIDIVVYTGITLTGATTLLIKYRKPDGSTGAWTATIVGGAPTYMHYVTQAGDLDQNGIWQLQAYVILGGAVGDGRIVSVKVMDPISLFGVLSTPGPTTLVPTTV
jgi:hypothetical protein